MKGIFERSFGPDWYSYHLSVMKRSGYWVTTSWDHIQIDTHQCFMVGHILFTSGWVWTVLYTSMVWTIQGLFYIKVVIGKSVLIQIDLNTIWLDAKTQLCIIKLSQNCLLYAVYLKWTFSRNFELCFGDFKLSAHSLWKLGWQLALENAHRGQSFLKSFHLLLGTLIGCYRQCLIPARWLNWSDFLLRCHFCIIVGRVDTRLSCPD